MERKQASPARKPWELSALAWTAGGIAAVCCLLHSLYQHEEEFRPTFRALSLGPPVSVNIYMRIGWPLPFAKGKKERSENEGNQTLTHDLSRLTSIEILPGGAAVDLLVLILLSFSAAYATERLKQCLPPQVTITGLLGISTLAAWEVQTAWKPSLAVDGGHDAARQIELMLVGSWGYSARMMRFLSFVACLVIADIVARVGAYVIARRRQSDQNGPAIEASKSQPLWPLGLAAAFTLLALLLQSMLNPRWHFSEGTWNRLEIGWPAYVFEGTIPDHLASDRLIPSTLAGLQNVSKIKLVPMGLTTSAAVWALFLFTSVYGVNWLLKKASGRISLSCICGTLLFLFTDTAFRFHGAYGWRMPTWSDLYSAVFIYNHELMQLLTLASCLFIPHMAFTLLGKLVSAMKPKPPRAEQAQTG